MKKVIVILLCFFTVILTGCSEKENSQTRILCDTAVTVTAQCDEEIINQSFDICAQLEKKLSRTVESSDIWLINNSDEFVSVGEETLALITRAIEYSEKSGGRFDITVYPVSSLYDFSSSQLPEKNEIARALEKVDYKKIEIKDKKVRLKDSGLDLGGIAKGYIADKMVEFLKEKGVKRGTVNIGGNLYAFGEGEFKIGIKKPFESGIIATVKSTENSFVTSGIYERYIEKDGRIYHHIIDTETGYGVENSLASVTVMGKSSADCDALSTALLILGEEEGLLLINETEGYEAVFVKRDGSILLSEGLKFKKDVIVYK